LARLRSSLSSLPLPAQTTKLASVSRVGLLAGNGNHCDYAVAEMHSTKLGRDEILRHYNQQSVPNPEGPSRFGVEVAFFDGNSPPRSACMTRYSRARKWARGSCDTSSASF
ncbi:MAG TPA: hypothetical protein PLQ87_09460, partial [Phycisphaerae bacterium]|nr:hypothetical protein [Phycisphaerae bacterium]